MNSNPYEPASTSQQNVQSSPANRRWSAAIGFVIAFMPIAALGAYGLYAEAQYAVTLPPNTARCGNGVISAMLIIFPISPMLGSLGAGIGFVAASVYNAGPIGRSPNSNFDN